MFIRRFADLDSIETDNIELDRTFTAAYSETSTVAIYSSKWRTDQHYQ